MTTGRPSTVALFVTCLVDLMRPGVAAAARRALELAGVSVDAPGGQTCCGQPAWNAGDRRAARGFADGWLEAFGGAEAVVTPSGSCAAMVRHELPRAVHPSRREEAAELASRTFELSQALVDLLGASDLGAALQGRAAYHPACHGYRGLGIERQPLRLLEAVRGLEIVPLQPECCGFGGLFSLRFPEVSVAVADRRLEPLEGVDFLVSTDLGCLLHLEGRLERRGSAVRTLHLAEVLAG